MSNRVRPGRKIIGYSGGGTIVVGMRGCTDQLRSISTIAGNLDPAAWAEHHGYTPLQDLSPLVPAAIARNERKETHWQCRDDLRVPPFVTDNYFAARAHAIRHIVDSCSHAEGWQQYWSQIIDSSVAD